MILQSKIWVFYIILVFILSRPALLCFSVPQSNPQSVVPCFTWLLDPNVLGSVQSQGQLTCCCVLAGFSRIDLYTLLLRLYCLAHLRVRTPNLGERICWRLVVFGQYWVVYSCHILLCFGFALLRRRQLYDFYLGRANIGHPPIQSRDTPRRQNIGRSQVGRHTLTSDRTLPWTAHSLCDQSKQFKDGHCISSGDQ